MSNELIKNEHYKIQQVDDQTMAKLVLGGDLSQLDPVQKVVYYNAFCNKLGLNPLTKPFQIINFQGKQILYATKDATEQLRKLHGVSICKLEKLFQDGLYIVTASAQDKDGRQDAASGAVSLMKISKDFKTGAETECKLTGEHLANAIMKAETKAKRRVTLSICGLGMLDESETDTIGDYKKIDISTGEVIETNNINKIGIGKGSNIEQEKTINAVSEEKILNEINLVKNIDELKKKYIELAKLPLSEDFSIKLINICAARKYELLTNDDIKQ